MQLLILFFILWLILILYKIIFPFQDIKKIIKNIFVFCGILFLILLLYFMPLIGIKLFSILGDNEINIGIYALIFWLGITILLISVIRFILSLLLALKIYKFYSNIYINLILCFFAIFIDIILYKIIGNNGILYYVLIYSLTFVYLPFFIVFIIKNIINWVKKILEL